MQKEEFKFKNKYRIPSARMPGCDYSLSGLYFVTICTKDRQCCFGKVQDGVVVLSEIGKMAQNIG